MKKKFIFLFLIAFIILLFKNYNLVLTSTINATNIWFYKVFPYLFIMIIIQDILINLNVSTLFKPSHYIFFMSIISGTPSSAFITGNMVKYKQISKSYGNTCLLFTYFANPLFLYTILQSIFNNTYIVIKLMLIHYLSNIIIYLFVRKNLKKDTNINTTSQKIDLSQSIRRSINTTLMVLGTIVFYFIICNIFISTFNINSSISFFIQGIVEMTQGLNSLIKITNNFKELFAIIFISFAGFSIHTQVKCILDEYNLDYKYFLKGRIYQTIIALMLTIIT